MPESLRQGRHHAGLLKGLGDVPGQEPFSRVASADGIQSITTSARRRQNLLRLMSGPPGMMVTSRLHPC
jgi:hypothetical protein